MKYLSNINRIHNCWNRFGKEYPPSFRYISASPFLMLPTTESYKITHKRKFWTQEKKFWASEIPTTKNWTHKCPQEKIWDPRNTYDKKFFTHEIPTRKYFGPMKHSRWHERWCLTHETNESMRPTKFIALNRNLYNSLTIFFLIKQWPENFKKFLNTKPLLISFMCGVTHHYATYW